MSAGVELCADCAARLAAATVGDRAKAVERAEYEEELRAKAIELVASRPGELSRTEVARSLGCRKRVGFHIVDRLVAEGVLGPRRPRAPLVVVEGDRDGVGVS